MLQHVSLPFSSYLLWDVDPDQVDLEGHAEFLIARIMDRGTMEDVEWAWKHYGPDKVRDALVQAPSLEDKTISFFAIQFGLSREQFRANRNRNSRWTP